MLEVSGGFQYWQPASRLNNAPIGAQPSHGPEQKRKQERHLSYWRKKNRKGRGGEGRDWLKETLSQKQRSTKETPHFSESRKECSEQAGMRILADRGPLALKTLLAVQFKWIKILNLIM